MVRVVSQRQETCTRASSRKMRRELASIRKDFADEYFTPASLAEFIKNAKRVNPNLMVNTDADSVNFMTEQVKKLSSIRNTAELIYVLEKNRKDVFSLIKELADFYTGAYSETLEANNKVSTQT